MPEIDILRAAFRESLAGGADHHLSEDEWERIACDEMVSSERERVLEHALECPLCSDTYRAILTLRADAATFDEAAPALPETLHPERSAGRRIRWYGLGVLAMAATAVLAIVVPMRRAHEPIVNDDVMVVRSAGDEQAVVPISPVGTVIWSTGEDVRLEWKAVEPPVSTFVELLDSEGEPIWTGPEVESTEVTWPGRDVPGPGRYYWRVIVRDSSGGVADSKLVSFELSASHP
jgi:hypothetical protein